ncbi:signal recognition particle-docking protein FtsY [Candidatus Woesearchaeota archaeon]|nr:signal recognition particle-docking protein FtsY [Candidatus Woesearchaeota archaeon]
MFGFLKDKLKKAISAFSKDVSKEADDSKEAESAPEKKEKKEKKEKEDRIERKQKGKGQKGKERALPTLAKKKEQKNVGKKEQEEISDHGGPSLAAEGSREPAAVPVAKPVPGQVAEPVAAKKGFFSRIKESFTAKEPAKEEGTGEEKEEHKEKKEKGRQQEPEEKKQEVAEGEDKEQEETEEKEQEGKGFFSRITDAVTKKTLSSEKFDELFWELEISLLENNVAVEVIEKIKGDLKAALVDTKLPRGKIEEAVTETLRQSMASLFQVPLIDILSMAEKKKPYVIVFGKTTTIAKMAHYLKKHKRSCVISASDTFRAAAIQQLEEHADKLGIKLIKHDYGADPAAVAFDAIKYAQSKQIDVVLVDTAGRLHSNTNLMDEMKKVIRVTKPDLKIFIGESITGNDCVEQARQFHDAISIDGIILAKADVDEKGGAAVSVSYITKKPILFLGTGQGYDDLTPFKPSMILGHLGL